MYIRIILFQQITYRCFKVPEMDLAYGVLLVNFCVLDDYCLLLTYEGNYVEKEKLDQVQYFVVKQQA